MLANFKEMVPRGGSPELGSFKHLELANLAFGPVSIQWVRAELANLCHAFLASFSLRSSFSLTASRMNPAIRLGPAMASILARVSASNLTSVGFVSTSFLRGGRPIRLPVSDCGNSVKAAS